MTKTSPLKAIKAKCTSCAGTAKKAADCPTDGCPLHIYRTGKNSTRPKRQMTEEQKTAARERIQKMHAARKAKQQSE